MSNVRAVWPLLWVSDVEAAISFWTEGLGFDVAGADGPPDERDWCRVVRGGASVMLQGGLSGGPPRGVSLYLVCDDVDAMREEIAGRGIPVSIPGDASYGMRQLRVAHPDGHEVWFESPTEGWKS